MNGFSLPDDLLADLFQLPSTIDYKERFIEVVRNTFSKIPFKKRSSFQNKVAELYSRKTGSKITPRTVRYWCKTTAYKKSRIPEDLKWEVFERDNFTCQHCGSRRYLTVDHIHPEYQGGKLTLNNCQTLCKNCNSRKGHG